MHPLNARIQRIIELEHDSVTISGYACCGFDVRSFVELHLLLRA